MLVAIFELSMTRRVSFLVFLLCIVISFNNRNADSKKGLNFITMSTTSYSVSSHDPTSDPSPLRTGSCPMAGNFKKAASLIFFWCTLFTAIRARKLRVIFGPWLGISTNPAPMSLVLHCAPFPMITSLRSNHLF